MVVCRLSSDISLFTETVHTNLSGKAIMFSLNMHELICIYYVKEMYKVYCFICVILFQVCNMCINIVILSSISL